MLSDPEKHLLEKIREYIKAKGCNGFTVKGLARYTGLGYGYVSVLLSRLARKGYILRVSRGSYVLLEDYFSRV